jgi:hypothetical protein
MPSFFVKIKARTGDCFIKIIHISGLFGELIEMVSELMSTILNFVDNVIT